MMFWRKKKNEKEQDRQDQEEKILHPDGEPSLELPVEYDADISEDQKHDIQKTEHDIIEELEQTPVPDHTPSDDKKEAEELSDHTEEGGWLSRLASGLKKSSQKFTDVLTKRKLDEAALEDLEDTLIMADLGPKTAAKIVAEFSATRFGTEVDENEIKQALADAMTAILDPVAKPIDISPRSNGKTNVILMTGVNGAGKTTTIGKMARQFQDQGKTVMLAAADTFRAAAVDQLKVWGARNKCEVVTKEVGADPAAVAFEAMQKAMDKGVDILLIDTAGRLHNKKNLMEELSKIIRVIQKQDETAPHSTLLVLDATTGQNAIAQVETFKELVDISGLVVTKLDGSAKGGIVVALADQFDIPVHAVGVGEGIKDLQPFTAENYARSLVGLE
ncbi:MAG: signal recognition particle-docking protein FtsY [Alphaproteobacteria bacterium]|nr:MAG: signal recognition particle-docking protein FtsY [Alphaproteobacteria bacterium]